MRRRRRPFDGRTGLACGRCRRRRMNREPTKWERCESAAVKSYTRARHCDARKRHHPLALVHAMAKVQVRIKTCFCCSLTVATIFIAIYTVVSIPFLRPPIHSSSVHSCSTLSSSDWPDGDWLIPSTMATRSTATTTAV
jgi:hypothetical protein